MKYDEAAFEAIREHELPHISSELKILHHGIWAVCNACWHPHPSGRPTVQMIHDSLLCWHANAVRTYYFIVIVPSDE